MMSDTLAALFTLPQVARIATTVLAPTDAIVVECDAPLTAEATAHLRAIVKDTWPGHPVLITGIEERP